MEPQTPQPVPGPRPSLVAQLKRMANRNSTDFWAWWATLDKLDRLALMAMDDVPQVGRR